MTTLDTPHLADPELSRSTTTKLKPNPHRPGTYYDPVEGAPLPRNPGPDLLVMDLGPVRTLTDAEIQRREAADPERYAPVTVSMSRMKVKDMRALERYFGRKLSEVTGGKNPVSESDMIAAMVYIQKKRVYPDFLIEEADEVYVNSDDDGDEDELDPTTPPTPRKKRAGGGSRKR